MKKQLLLLFLAVSMTATAQKFTIRGQLTDTLSNPLPSATVLLLNPVDSSLVNFGVGDVQGNFELRNVAQGEHLFKVTFMGFRPYMQKITPPATGGVVEMGKIRMIPVSKELAAIEIAADQAPVIVKKDTIEFNAGAFKTKQNAVVEDLLKRLPGVEVDNDGNITAQGEQVKRVTVDGKNFFGNDPKLATRNLPADAINKVQVFDKKSDQAAFSGIDDGQREKTINLELKEEKRNGVFGNVMAGAGTDDRLQAKANLNRFTRGRQLSLLAMGNNTNEQGFGMDDYLNFTGGSQQMMSGGGGVRLQVNGDNANGVPLSMGRANGIMTTYAGGANANNTFNKKTEVNASYFYNYLDHDKDQITLRQNFVPGGNFTFNQNSRQRNTNANHRVNLTLDHKLDSANSLKLTANVTRNETDSEVTSTSENITPDNTLQNESERLTLANGSNSALNATLLWRHKFGKKGRTLSTTLQLGASRNDREGWLDAVNTYYGTNESEQRIRQNSNQSTEYTSYGGAFSYTEPLGNRKYLEANYNFRQNLNDVNKFVYDIDADQQASYNASLSNQYTSDYQYHRAGLNFRMNKSKYNLLVGGSMQRTFLEGDLKVQDVQISRSYQNVLPAVRFNYDFSTSRHLRFDYETSVQEPTIQQLQPVVDNSDPLNLYVGNTALRPAYVQSWRLNYMTFDQVTFVSFFAFATIDYTTNAITTAQYIDENLVRTSTPVNVDNNLSMSGNASFMFPVAKLKSRFTVGSTYRNQRSINLLNDVANTIHQETVAGNLRYNFRYNNIFDLSLTANKNYQLTRYEFEQPQQTFINSTYTAESNLTFLKNYQLNAELEYLEYENRSTGFSQAIPLLDLAISRFILKNKSGEIKFSVNNLLDKALGINQTASSNYLERETITSLGRYFMVSFTYALNKQLNPMGMRRGGGPMMRINRGG